MRLGEKRGSLSAGGCQLYTHRPYKPDLGASADSPAPHGPAAPHYHTYLETRHF